MSVAGKRDMHISVITPTLNVGEKIRRLAESLELQEQSHFEWIVVDGGSVDETLSIVAASSVRNKVIVSKGAADGVYSAINQGLSVAKCDYYMMAGGDDRFMPGIFARLIGLLEANKYDLLVGNILKCGKVERVKRGSALFFGMRSVVAGHSVGVVIKKSLHEKYGLYDVGLRVAADVKFMLMVNASSPRALYLDVVFGEFSVGGISCTQKELGEAEVDEIKLLMGYNYMLVRVVRVLMRLWSRFRQGGGWVSV